MADIVIDYDYLVDGQPIDADDVKIPLQQLQQAIEGMLEGGIRFEALGFIDPGSVTISSGILTLIQAWNNVANEAAASSDSVATIIGPKGLVVLRQPTGGHSTTFEHNTGNIFFASGVSYTLDSANKLLVLWWNPDVGKYFSYATVPDVIRLPAPEGKTISAATITADSPFLSLQPESGNIGSLSTILNPQNLGMIFVKLGNDAYTITFNHNTGNLFVPSEENVVLTGQSGLLPFVWNPVLDKWIMTGGGSKTSITVADATGQTFSTDRLLVAQKSVRQLTNSQILLDFMPSLSVRRQAGMTANYAAAYQTSFHTPTTLGTLTQGVFNEGITVKSTVGSGKLAGFYTDADFAIMHSPELDCRVQIESLSNQYFIGMMTAVPTWSGAAWVFTGISGVFLLDSAICGYNNGTQLFSVALTNGLIVGLNRIKLTLDYANNKVAVLVNNNPIEVTTQTLSVINTAVTRFAILMGSLAATQAFSVGSYLGTCD